MTYAERKACAEVGGAWPARGGASRIVWLGRRAQGACAMGGSAAAGHGAL